MECFLSFFCFFFGFLASFADHTVGKGCLSQRVYYNVGCADDETTTYYKMKPNLTDVTIKNLIFSGRDPFPPALAATLKDTAANPSVEMLGKQFFNKSQMVKELLVLFQEGPLPRLLAQK